MAQEVGEEVELLGGEREGLAVAADLVGDRVELEVAGPQDGRGRRRRRHRAVGPAEHGLHPRRQLAGRERLGDVVVGAELQPGDAVVLVSRAP